MVEFEGKNGSMTRQAVAILAGVLLLAEAAWADQSPGSPGRYQVIPDAMVPGKGTKPNERAVLLDSATGQTWILAPGPGFGGLPGPVWIPLVMQPTDRAERSAKPSAAPKSANKQQAVGKPQPAPNWLERPFDRFEYEDNP